MRVNVYAEEMTEKVEIISKTTDCGTFTGVRFYLQLPVTIVTADEQVQQIRGPFMHNPGDDDSAAVTFWGKRGLRAVLQNALDELDKYYQGQDRSR